MYEKRKAYMVGQVDPAQRKFINPDFQVGMMAGEAGKLSNQARFILEKCDGTLKVKRNLKN